MGGDWAVVLSSRIWTWRGIIWTITRDIGLFVISAGFHYLLAFSEVLSVNADLPGCPEERIKEGSSGVYLKEWNKAEPVRKREVEGERGNPGTWGY